MLADGTRPLVVEQNCGVSVRASGRALLRMCSRFGRPLRRDHVWSLCAPGPAEKRHATLSAQHTSCDAHNYSTRRLTCDMKRSACDSTCAAQATVHTQRDMCSVTCTTCEYVCHATQRNAAQPLLSQQCATKGSLHVACSVQRKAYTMQHSIPHAPYSMKHRICNIKHAVFNSWAGTATYNMKRIICN